MSTFFLIGFYYSQGSGYTLAYNGTSNYTTIPHYASFSSHANGEISVEAWIKIDAINTDAHGQVRQPIVAKGNGGSWEWALYVYDYLGIGFSTWRCNGAGHSEISGGSIVLGQWHHVAASFDDNNFNRVYIDGILVSQGTSFSGTACSAVRPVRIASREDGQYLDGSIDEVRIWNKALTQTEIRDNMCQTLSPPLVNLTAYYRFDEGANNTCSATEDLCDLSGNGHNGTNINNPTWNFSDAAIGDVSVHYYPGNWAGQSLNLTTPNKGNFTLDNVTGNPDGIHIFRVDAQPNSVTGIPFGLGSNDTYYGTFVSRYPWTGDFEVEFDYANYPDAITNEPDLEIYERNNNSILTWTGSPAVQNMGLDEFMISGVTARREYILAAMSGALPIELIDFYAFQKEKEVHLHWNTSSEKNSSHFQIERSLDGFEWTQLSKVDAAGNSNSLKSYDFIDRSPQIGLTYYRLNQIDIDGSSEYSDIRSVIFSNGNELNVYPNPATSVVYIRSADTDYLSMFSLGGKRVNLGDYILSSTATNMTLNIEDLEPGVYFIQSLDVVQKLIIR